ncbi:MAG: flavin reductase family protein [Calditrichaeota bacterium]|nr:flavin reductase family protein [Calditrichota bacterium]
MKTLLPADLSISDAQRLISSAIGPRPIALVSTVSAGGIRNLAPFSFFNAFSGNPPVVIFSPSRKGRDGSLKDTYHNIKSSNECAIGIVTYDMVEQVSLASSEYPPEVDEFIKSGLTPVDSEFINAPGIAESPVWFECKVRQVIELAETPGSGNLVIADIIAFHVDELMLNGPVIDPNGLRAIGRFGENYYVKAFGDALFRVDKPVGKGIGFDQLPDYMRNSHRYTGNHLGRFANVDKIPEKDQLRDWFSTLRGETFDQSKFEQAEIDQNPAAMLKYAISAEPDKTEFLERTAIAFLETNQFELAWRTAMLIENF